MDASIAAQEPRVEPVLPQLLQVDFPVWLVTHREIHNSPRIRLVFDHLAEVLARV
jgi:DNA-binding transcriptional LysR family regulator